MTKKTLTILGSGAQQPTRFRNTSSYFLRWGVEGFLFDAGEGTQRQCIFAGIAPPSIERIFISHFHGDHCVGLGSILMRLNLDSVSHTIHVYYPASGKKYFDRLKYGSIFHERIKIVEHPISCDGVIYESDFSIIKAYKADHGVECFCFRVEEKERVRFKKDIVAQLSLNHRDMASIAKGESIEKNGAVISSQDLSYIQKGAIFVYIADTVYCEILKEIAKDATLLLIEATYLHEHEHLATSHHHLTAKQAATIAKKANVNEMLMTHFSARYNTTKVFEEEAKLVFQKSKAVSDLDVFDIVAPK